mgnify:CR=1 FL=1
MINMGAGVRPSRRSDASSCAPPPQPRAPLSRPLSSHGAHARHTLRHSPQQPLQTSPLTYVSPHVHDLFRLRASHATMQTTRIENHQVS